MKYFTFIIFTLLACSNEQEVGENKLNKVVIEEVTQTEKMATVEKMDSPVKETIETFETFFEKFRKDKNFQTERIIFPITIAEWEMGEDTPTEKRFTRSTWSFDDFEPLKESGGFKKINESTEDFVSLTVGYENSDVYANYIFKKIKGLWYLTRIES